MQVIVNDVGVLQVHSAAVSVFAAVVLGRDGKVFDMPEGMVDQRSFFQGVRCTLPLDPPVLKDSNWDALADSLWCGLHALSQSSILIVWPSFRGFKERDPEGFAVATELMSVMCTSLSDEALVAGRSKYVTVLQLLGD